MGGDQNGIEHPVGAVSDIVVAARDTLAHEDIIIEATYNWNHYQHQPTPLIFSSPGLYKDTTVRI